MRSIIPAVLVAGTLAALAACERATTAVPESTPRAASAGAEGAPPPVSNPAAVSREAVERLQALGYVDVADEPADGRAGVVLRDVARSSPGYNVFTNAHLCSTQLIDADGNVVRTWTLEPCYRWDNTSLLPDGDLLVVGRAQKPGKNAHEGGRGWAAGRYVARLAWDGAIRWKVPLGAHHDAQLTPRDEVAVLTARTRRVPEVDEGRGLKDDALTLLAAHTGEVRASASLYDLLKTAPADQFRFRTPTVVRGRGPVDLLHANAVWWMQDAELAARHPLYAPSNVLVTFRHQDAIAIVDWDAKRVVWAWGQGELSGPHDAVVLPSGNILVFDNGLGRDWSRVVELDPKTRTIVWEYRATDPKSFYTQTRGANQRLENGNTLIAQSDAGRAFEVTPDGTIVWEFLNPNLSEGKRGALVRMRRIAPDVVRGWLARLGQAGATSSAAH